METEKIFIIEDPRDEIDLTRTLNPEEHLKIQLVNSVRDKPLKVTGEITLKPGSDLELLQLDLGRFDCMVDLKVNVEEGACFTSRVGAMCEGVEHKSYTIDVIHVGRNSESLTTMRGVCKDRSKMEFLGSSDIRRGAAKTHTRQEGKIVNLSGKASCVVSPSLLISEEDVFASHGASMGSVPDQDMFYLMSRGLDRPMAERIITVGYLKPTCSLVEDERAKQVALSMLESEL